METDLIPPGSSPTLTSRLSRENLLIAVILILALFSRFIDLGSRAMSHDEINHVVPSYEYAQGGIYRYDPMTHGPLQFHLIALSFFFFGDSDFSARIPVALFSCATVAVAMFGFRRFLGRTASLLAGGLFLISPYMLFYGRYARNEAFIVLWGLVGLWAILGYLERGSRRYLYTLTLVTALHFTDKATSYIFAGEQVAFLGLYLLARLLALPWPDPGLRKRFGLALCASASCAVFALALNLSNSLGLLLLIPAAALLILAGSLFQRGPGFSAIRQQRSFHLLMLLLGLTLPFLGALALNLLGLDPLNYAGTGVPAYLAAFIPLALLGLGTGYLALGREIWKHYAIFYIPFILFYTSFFSNPAGLGGGLFGALGYWMDQQAVNRGSQPWYYYAFLQIPLYEFLPALGALGALLLALRRKLWQTAPAQPFQPAGQAENPVPAPAFFLFWATSSLLAFSIAGEKMPWLTIHIALPLILGCAWFLGWLFEARPAAFWKRTLRYTCLLGAGLLAIFTARAAYRAAFLNADLATEYMVYAHSAPDPKHLLMEIEDLSRKTTGGLELAVAYDNAVRYPYWWYLRKYSNRIDYDVNPTASLRNASVVLVGEANYARVERLLGDEYVMQEGIRMWWPNMDYWNLKWDSLAAEFTAAHPDAPAMGLLDYLGRIGVHVWDTLRDPARRAALWQIWLNRDYSLYAASRPAPQEFTLAAWRPSERMRIYIRKDLLAKIYGYSYTAPPAPTDPYQDKLQNAVPDQVVGKSGTQPGQFQSPRSLALAPDGSLYVADSRNHRIQRLAAGGQSVLQAWGSFADAAASSAPGGTFNEPWGLALAPDGSLYVADTWNHRIQKFDAQGNFLGMWGHFGKAATQDSFWGPRAVAVDSAGRVYVVDTGNKRVVIFDSNGNYLSQFGSAGSDPGQFDEPVGIAIAPNGLVYVADTWNQRIQVFQDPAGDLHFELLLAWDVSAWDGASVENKPYLALAPNGDLLATDPETCRVLDFNSQGVLRQAWSACQPGGSVLSALAIDPDGALWVSDALQCSLLKFNDFPLLR